MSAFFALIARDIRVALRQLSDTLMVIVFFVIAAALFPFGVGAEPNLLARIAPGILWVTALLSAMLSFDRLFQNDFEDGTLDLLVVAPQPLWVTSLAKIIAHWLTTGLPFLVAAPMIGIILNLNVDGYIALSLAMALGTAIISLIGALGAALTLGSRRSGVLFSLLVLPLVIPVLIFGVGAVEASIGGYAVTQQLLLLGGLLLASLVLCPWGCSIALKFAVD
ncbi:MAG: Heme exporter protein B [Alphaproteobacteria bacterium MarineAlpha11_Bin1]|nr:MAG: Heme exporter protein B [Alphaproteobacteria bacterium MarineAlpha11_Bin1]|tara:strand:- start:8814 stop:9479 length:666 start_codon:yes stop_codon:yes gene_type:complete